MKNWYKKWWIWAIIVFALIAIALPFMIDQCYKSSNEYVHIWGVADMLAYYGSLLSFIGTVVLGVIAVWQNRKANEINDRLLNLESLKKKEQIFDLYLSYVEEIDKIFDPLYIFDENEKKTHTEIYGSICSCGDRCIEIRRKLYYFDHNNAENPFFQYTLDLVNDMMKIATEKDDKRRFDNIFDYIDKYQKDYTEYSFSFLNKIYNSLYKEDTPNE